MVLCFIFAARDVIEAINSCQNLHYLNLEGNTLGVDAAKGIAKALESHSEFKRALWKDLFTGRMKTEIPKALVSNIVFFSCRICYIYMYIWSVFYLTNICHLPCVKMLFMV
jgi:uncharacterized MAPEG superfamily protein